MDYDSLEREALALDLKSRGRLAAILLRSLDDLSDEMSEEEIQRLWAEEADRRSKELDSGEEEAIPYEDVLAGLRSRFGVRLK